MEYLPHKRVGNNVLRDIVFKQNNNTVKEKRRKMDLNYVKTLVGEGNGNPLQYSCLENPMAGGAW